jgi:hypothetical protein
MAKKDKDKLIKQINEPEAAPEPEPVEVEEENPGEGRAVTFWLDKETQEAFKRLRMLLVQEDVKFNDSLILRTALDLVPSEPRLFVERAKELKKRDGRRLRLQKPTAMRVRAGRTLPTG